MGAQNIVSKMIAGWEALDVEAIAACLSEDAVWHNMPYPPISGREAVAAAIRHFVDGATEVKFHVRYQGEIAPGVVVNERTDTFVMKDGKSLIIPVAGVFEIKGGLIYSWRDYFDPAAMNN